MLPELTIALVDDHPVVIEGLKTVIASHLPEAKTLTFTMGHSLLDDLKRESIQIVLLDLMLTDMNGIDLCRQVKMLKPDTIVVGLSNQSERSLILQLLQNGASGYVLKNAAPEEIIHCILETQKGNIAFSSEVREIMSKPTQADLRVVPSVTKREAHILRLLALGKSTPVIAAEINLSPLTVDTHRRNLLQKFQVKNTAELLMAAVQLKLL